MAIKVKHKNAPRNARRHSKKTAHHEKEAPPHRKKTRAHREKKAPVVHAPAKHMAPTKPIASVKPAASAKRPAAKSILAQRPKARREFFVAAEPVRGSVALPSKKKKKKHKMVLRFTENTLKDIAALECVRRCFR